MSDHGIKIVDAASGQLVQAKLHDELGVDALMDVEDQWAPYRAELRQLLRDSGLPSSEWPQSLHWDWSRKSVQLTLGGDPDDYRIFGICHQEIWEGAMVTRRKGRVAKTGADAGKANVYVDYLEVAPWNWTVKAAARTRRYKGLGPALLLAAVEQSYAMGNDGRIGLHSLPQAESFCQKQGLEFVCDDQAKRLPYYELSTVGALGLKKG